MVRAVVTSSSVLYQTGRSIAMEKGAITFMASSGESFLVRSFARTVLLAVIIDARMAVTNPITFKSTSALEATRTPAQTERRAASCCHV